MVTCNTETKQAVAEIRQAFGEVLKDFTFTFVISNPREPDNPIVYASPDFFTLTGYGAAEVLGKNCRFLQGPGTSHQSVMEIRDAIREDRPCSVCLLNYKKDGTKFWNAFHLAPLRSPSSGNVEFYVGLQADVTQLVEAGEGTACAAGVQQEELQRAQQIGQQLSRHRQEWEGSHAAGAGRCAADHSVPSSMLCALSKLQDCFVLSDPNLPDNPIVYASPSFLSMTGYSCSEVVGRNCRFLQGPGTDPSQIEVLRAALSCTPPRPATVTLLNYRRDGTPFWNCLHIAPIRDADGKVQFHVGVQLDATAHGTGAQQLLQQQGQQQGEGGGEQQNGLCGADGLGGRGHGGLAQEGHARAVRSGPAGASQGSGGEELVHVGEAEVPRLNQPSAMLLLRQKGVVGSVRVASRALAQHGLRREVAFQRRPSHKGQGREGGV